MLQTRWMAARVHIMRDIIARALAAGPAPAVSLRYMPLPIRDCRPVARVTGAQRSY